MSKEELEIKSLKNNLNDYQNLKDRYRNLFTKVCSQRYTIEKQQKYIEAKDREVENLKIELNNREKIIKELKR